MKNIFKATLAVAAVATVGMGSYKAYTSYVSTNGSMLMDENVQALSGCEITKKDNTVFKCVGNEPLNGCTESYWGYTLTCDGKKVN